MRNCPLSCSDHWIFLWMLLCGRYQKMPKCLKVACLSGHGCQRKTHCCPWGRRMYGQPPSDSMFWFNSREQTALHLWCSGFAHRFGPLVFSSNSQSQKDLEVFFAALDLASHSHQTSKWNGAPTTITIGRTMLLVLFRLSALMMIPYLIVPGHPYRISFYSRAWYTSLYGNSR